MPHLISTAGLFGKAVRGGIAAALFAGGVGFAAAARADSEIVVAIRYFTATGTSHAHLYLYRQDGKLLRQLTNDNSGQDRNPEFAPDGETIVFSRATPKAGVEYWTIRPRGGGLARLNSAPVWYKPDEESPYFTNTDTNSAETTAATPTYRSPDGAVEIALRQPADDPDKDVDGPGHGRHFVLRDLKSNRETELGKLPDFLGLYEVLHNNKDPNKRFLLENGLRLAFFGLHLDSTDGDTDFALDLTHPRLVRLAHNWASPHPLPGEPAFLTMTESRYIPIPGTQKTANSSYIERWDAALHKVRYAHAGAALTYGGSMYRPGHTPAVINIRSEDD